MYLSVYEGRPTEQTSQMARFENISNYMWNRRIGTRALSTMRQLHLLTQSHRRQQCRQESNSATVLVCDQQSIRSLLSVLTCLHLWQHLSTYDAARQWHVVKLFEMTHADTGQGWLRGETVGSRHKHQTSEMLIKRKTPLLQSPMHWSHGFFPDNHSHT